eukprot:m.89079 g.89079  ORF g.89079 m.89079 type:complete len:254 (+) comp16437_c0_seq3:110-871(+)
MGKHSMFHHLWTISLAIAVNGVDTVTTGCNYVHNGETFDMSGLKSSTYYSVNSTNYVSYGFVFNVCNSIDWEDPKNPSVCTLHETGACEFQYINDEEIAIDAYGYISTGSWSHMDDRFGFGPGPVYNMTGIDCKRSIKENTTATAVIVAVCDQSAVVPRATAIDSDYWECTTSFAIHSKDACLQDGTKFRCVNNHCVASETGVSAALCEESCGDGTFVCFKGACVTGTDGGTKEECEKMCKGENEPFAAVDLE